MHESIAMSACPMPEVLPILVSSTRWWSAFVSHYACRRSSWGALTENSFFKRQRISRTCMKRTCLKRPVGVFSCLKPGDFRPVRLKQSNGHLPKATKAVISGSELASTLVLIVTAVAGGRSICVCGFFFLLLGKYTMAPFWLQATSTVLCASIADALSQNWASVTLDSGITPFLVFLLGSGVTVLLNGAYLSRASRELNIDQIEQRSAFESKEDQRAGLDVPDNNAKNPDNELAQWDELFNEARGHMRVRYPPEDD